MNQSVQHSFRALGDSTRRAILMQLCEEDLSITAVVEKFELTRTAVRKHLTILEEGNLITVTAIGKERISKLNPEGLKSVAEWFDFFSHFWDSSLNSLKYAAENEALKQLNERSKND